MKTKSLLLALFMLLSISKLSAQDYQQPLCFEVNSTGFAKWISPDRAVIVTQDFNDGQIPEGWTLSSEGQASCPWHIQTPQTNPYFNDFPSDGSPYLYVQSDTVSNQFLEELFTTDELDVSDAERIYLQYNYLGKTDNGDAILTFYVYDGLWKGLTLAVSGSGIHYHDITEYKSHSLKTRFDMAIYPVGFYGFGMDDLSIVKEMPENVTNNVLGFKIWLDGVFAGETNNSEFQINTDTLTEYQQYNVQVAAIYSDSITEPVSYNFVYHPCSDYPAYRVFDGSFTDSTTVELNWSFGDAFYVYSPVDIVTHPDAGYNNGWDVSALHDGMTTYGIEANHEDGYMIADKFTVDGGDIVPNFITGIGFYVYQDASPRSTITGVYIAIYDDDPSNGGQIIYGNPNENVLVLDKMANIYRTGENDFSDVQRPVAMAKADLYIEEIPNGTYWFTASFTGSVSGGVYAVPRTLLSETETGEALVYQPETGWQPAIDSGTQTQQGFAFSIFSYSTGGVPQIDRTNVFRDGEFIGSTTSSESYIDENVPHGVHTYSIQCISEGYGASCLKTIDVRPCYSPKNLDGEIEYQSDSLYLAHIFWDAADNIPQREDITKTYNVYRKYENQYQLIAVIPSDEADTSYSFTDTLRSGGDYFYKVNAYYVYPNGSCLSNYAPYINDNQLDYVYITTGREFAPIGAKWYYEIYPASGNGTAYYEMMESSGDTIINGKKKVKIIIKTPAMYKQEIGREYVYYDNGFVYWYNQKTNDFTKLYNFCAEKYDYWHVDMGDYRNRILVTDISYEEIQGETYKILHVNDEYNDFNGKIICGIGNETYLFPFSTFGERAEGDYPRELRCYFENEDNLILSIGDYSCDAIYTVSLDEIKDNQYVIYPNPANSIINIKGDEIDKIEILNVLGQIVYSNENDSNKNLIINASSWTKGIYIINITDIQDVIHSVRLILR